jgi:hypothetical protein
MTEYRTKRRIRHIIKPPGAYEAFRALASRNGLQIINKVERDPQNPIALEEIFGDIDRTVGIHYIEDGLAEVPYIQIAGPRAEYFTQLITQALPFYSEEELFATWDTARSLEDKIDAILRLGVASDTQPSDPYLTRIRQALEDAAPEVRSAGLVAFSYNPWDEMKPLVEKIRDEDPDADARDRARIILDTWKKTAESQ